MFLVDIASYQDGLTPADAARAGFHGINVKVSHGLGQHGVHSNAAGWVHNTAGLAVSTFHYLTGDAPGAAQARYACERLNVLGVPGNSPHTVDCESDADWQTIVEYVTAMRLLLHRPVALYTGRWWWQDPGRGWAAPDLLPYVWAAPDKGYLTRYPGDTDSRWAIRYAGHTSLAVMQYAVGPVARTGGQPIDVSMSAIRDPAIWADLSTPREGGVTVAPDSLKEARAYILKETGIDPLSVGIVGDDNHLQTGSSYHLGKSALRPDSYSIIESSRDRNGLSEDAAALDIGMFSIKRGGKTHTLRTFSVWLFGECVRGAPDTSDIREVIFSPDGKVVKRWDRLGKRSTGDDSHLVHTHMSWFRDSTKRSKVGLFQRYFREIKGDDMPLSNDMIKVTKSLAQRLNSPDYPEDSQISAATLLMLAVIKGFDADNKGTAALAGLNAIAQNVAADDNDLAVIQSAIAAAQAATVQGVISGLADEGRSDTEVADALRAALGVRAPAVGALLQNAPTG
jgi:hypothetical protein